MLLRADRCGAVGAIDYAAEAWATFAAVRGRAPEDTVLLGDGSRWAAVVPATSDFIPAT
ncbi:MAG: hypothetical protein H6703_14780 [Myxococcales bacterium]|nr:hypothetical protein [Myxococcales bacterium]